MLSARTRKVLPWVVALAVLHMTDSVLGGRTFQAPYVPATPIQGVHLPVLLPVFLDVGSGWVVGYSAGGLVAHLFGHYLIPSQGVKRTA